MSAAATGLVGQIPALQVVLPLVAAPACILLHQARRAWWLVTIVSFVSAGMAASLLVRVLEHGPVSYALGGWAAPWGIEYRIDALNGLMLVLVSGASAATLLFARASVEREVAPERIYLFYTAWLLCVTGLLGITITGDAFNVFVFLEISSLATYTLVSFGHDRRALSAAFRYLVMGTVGGTFILIGIGLLYGVTGTLNMADLSERIRPHGDSGAVRAAFAFITVGAGLKIAMFPLHAWLPGAYASAPSAATAFIAATSTKVAMYVLIRFTFTIYGDRLSVDAIDAPQVLMTLAAIGVFVASAVAIGQRDLKRMLAWSSISQVGYMLMGLAAANMNGLTASIVHMFNHAVIKSALFMALGCVAYRAGSATMDNVAGLGRRMPWTFAAFSLAALGLIGVPFTAGFVSKWYLLVAVLERGWWPAAALIVVASLMAVVYVGRVIEAAYFRTPRGGTVTEKAQEAPVSMLVPLWLLALANLYLGVETDLTVGVARIAAASLLGAAP